MGMRYTFRGGVHIDDRKNTANVRTEMLPSPPEVSIPMSQHIGAPCHPIVGVGDHVLVGQKIGEVEGLGCPVHSSISGTVKELCEVYTPAGRKVQNIVIENDGKGTVSPDIAPLMKKLSECTPDEIIDRIREAGISGMGGATFPTHAKISSAIGRAELIIINCAECEPYITANHRLILEYPSSVVNGAKILMKALGVRKTYFAIEDNKLDAANVLEEFAAKSELLEVKLMRTKYPQGDERQLIYALTGKELSPGKLPADVGVVIFNAETCAAVYNALSSGLPLISRIVTVDGDCVRRPMNFIVPIGTRASYIAECCGGLLKQPERIVFGGPMMGQAAWDKDSPVTKGTSAILFLSEDEIPTVAKESVCISCGKCVRHCPMHLMPCYIARYSRAHDFAAAKAAGAMSCVECGSCSYICPEKIEVVQLVRVAKAEIRAMDKKTAKA